MARKKYMGKGPKEAPIPPLSKEEKKKMPEGMVPLQPWDPKKKTPWIEIPTWPKGKRAKPTPLASGGIAAGMRRFNRGGKV